MLDLMEQITSLAKRRGIVFPSSEIYGGLRSSWDYGPLEVELKRNVKDAWWRAMVQLRDDVVGLDAAIIMSPKVWEASGHLEVSRTRSSSAGTATNGSGRTICRGTRRPVPTAATIRSRTPATST